MPPSKRPRALSHSAVVCIGNPATGMCLAGSNRMGRQTWGLKQSEENMILHVPADFSGVKNLRRKEGGGEKEERRKGRRANKGVLIF